MQSKYIFKVLHGAFLGRNVQDLSNTDTFYLDGKFVPESSANLILTMKANGELEGVFETCKLEEKDYPQAMNEFCRHRRNRRSSVYRKN